MRVLTPKYLTPKYPLGSRPTLSGLVLNRFERLAGAKTLPRLDAESP